MLHLTLMLAALGQVASPGSDDLAGAFRMAARSAYNQTVKNLRRPADTAVVMIDTLSFRRHAEGTQPTLGSLASLVGEFGTTAQVIPHVSAVECLPDRSRCQTKDEGVIVSLDGMARQDSTLTLDVRISYTDRRPSGAMATGFETWRVTMLRRGNGYVVTETKLRMLS